MDFEKKKIGEIGESLVEKAVDMVLVAVYFNLEAPWLLRTRRRYQIGEKVDGDLEKFNYQSLKRALAHLRQKGLVQTVKEAETLPKITESGEKRLKEIVPFYDEKRVWDGRVYLVSYDIPVKKTRERNYLREYLRKIGCGSLQQSMWLTPYNPTRLLKKFTEKYDLRDDLILVSSIGKNGSIGETTLTDLMEQVYHLNNLNQRYREFIFEFSNKQWTKAQLVLWFLSILKDDPQIPFALLPSDWVGDKAYRLFKKLQTG